MGETKWQRFKTIPAQSIYLFEMRMKATGNAMQLSEKVQGKNFSRWKKIKCYFYYFVFFHYEKKYIK